VKKPLLFACSSFNSYTVPGTHLSTLMHLHTRGCRCPPFRRFCLAARLSLQKSILISPPLLRRELDHAFSISGTPGTGKIAEVCEVIPQLQYPATFEGLDKFTSLPIHGMKVTDTHQAYSLCEAIKGECLSLSQALRFLESELSPQSFKGSLCGLYK